ncbi:MAG: extradiol ring-cleavage dioxygenase [Hyphomicrobiaceae bacterium]
MAEIVATFGVPHTPMFPALVARDGPQCETAKLYAEVTRHLEAVQPDVLVVFDSDHLNTFFLDNLPTFAVGIADTVVGPNDHTAMPTYTVPVQADFGTHLRAHGIGAGFDLSLAQDFTIDHSLLVPLHFLTPHMRIPIVPVFVNGLAPPLPLSKRCHALGRMVRDAVAAWPGHLRVAIVASGSFSLEVGGPRARPGTRSGTPDPGWAKRVKDHMDAGRVNDLLNEATSDRMLAAGNVGGELLNWIAMLGAIGDRKPRFLEPQASHGHAYGAWRWDS